MNSNLNNQNSRGFGPFPGIDPAGDERQGKVGTIPPPKPPIIISAPYTTDHGHVLVHARNLANSMEQTVIVKFSATMQEQLPMGLRQSSPEVSFLTRRVVISHEIQYDARLHCAVPQSVIVTTADESSITERT